MIDESQDTFMSMWNNLTMQLGKADGYDDNIGEEVTVVDNFQPIN